MLEFIDIATIDILQTIFYFFVYFFLLQFSYWLFFAFYNAFFVANEQENGRDENINIFFHNKNNNIAIKRKIL
jgi:hypothetical protein